MFIFIPLLSTVICFMYISVTVSTAAQLCVVATTPIKSHCHWFLCVWLLLKHTSIRPGKFPFQKNPCCCVFDALIKKFHFICIINAAEMKRQEQENSLKLSKQHKVSFYSLFASSSGDGQDVFAVSQKGVSWQGRVLSELKLWKHTM